MLRYNAVRYTGRVTLQATLLLQGKADKTTPIIRSSDTLIELRGRLPRLTLEDTQ